MPARQHHEAQRRGQRAVEAGEGMGGGTPVQCTGGVGAQVAGEHGGGQHRARTEGGQPERVARNADHRPEQIGREIVEMLSEVTDETFPPLSVGSHPRSRLVDRLVEHPGATVVERMGAIDVGQRQCNP